MCGISGVISHDKGNAVELVKGMVRIQQKRGPDANAVETISNYDCFGFNRLSIIDLETGMQPFWNETKTIVTICNGEIYNFKELKNELISKGHVFYSKSDCEIIPHAYEEWGTALFSRLNGMFAIAIFDKRSGELILGRDHLGIKPLCYFFDSDSGSFLFASNMNALLWAVKEEKFKLTVDHNSLCSYFHLCYIPSPGTFYKEISKLPPATYLKYKRKFSAQIVCYWDISAISSASSVYYSMDSLSDMIEKSVKSQLIADVPLGIFLSGGIDSSLLSFYASKYLPEIEAFNMGFKEREYDESSYASEVASRLNIRLNSFNLDIDGTFQCMGQIVREWGEPFGDSSALPTWFISKYAGERVKCILSGDGADEIFGGYETYQANKILKILNFFPGHVLSQVLKMVEKFSGGFYDEFTLRGKLQRLLYGVRDKDPFKSHFSWRYYFDEGQLNNLLPELVPEVENYRDRMVEKYFKPFKNFAGTDPDSKFMAFDTSFYLPNDMLFKVDSMSMAHSLEVRVPFLDRNIVETALRIPSHMKFNHARTKIILRDMCKKIYPHEIWKRKKKGFTIPVAKWFSQGLGERLMDLLQDTNKSAPFINTDYVKVLLQEHQSGKKNNGYRLWVVFAFILWYQR